MEGTILLKGNSFEKIKKEVSLNFGKRIIFTCDDDELNRKVLEKLKIDILLINLGGRKDFQKQRNSGFNQVFAKICQKNKIKIGVNLDEIIDSHPRVYTNTLKGIKEVREYPKGTRPFRGPEKFSAKTFTKGKNKSDILARVRQNVKLCNKNKIDIVFVGKNRRDLQDLKSLGLILGMPTWMTSDLANFQCSP